MTSYIEILSVSLWILLNAQLVSNTQEIFLDSQWKKGLQGERESQNKHDHRTHVYSQSCCHGHCKHGNIFVELWRGTVLTDSFSLGLSIRFTDPGR